jgi:hypothetical protein
MFRTQVDSFSLFEQVIESYGIVLVLVSQETSLALFKGIVKQQIHQVIGLFYTALFKGSDIDNESNGNRKILIICDVGISSEPRLQFLSSS